MDNETMLYYLLVFILFAFFSYIFSTFNLNMSITNTNAKGCEGNESNSLIVNSSNIDNRIIVTYKNDKYDITDFIKRHPGGKDVLIKNNGKDIEQLMIVNEHSEHAYNLLRKYKISE